LMLWGKEKCFAPARNLSLVIHPVAWRYTDWAYSPCTPPERTLPTYHSWNTHHCKKKSPQERTLWYNTLF
jgi:hypothetical protein